MPRSIYQYQCPEMISFYENNFREHVKRGGIKLLYENNLEVSQCRVMKPLSARKRGILGRLCVRNRCGVGINGA